MLNLKGYQEQLLHLTGESFDLLALEVFRHQYQLNPVYHEFVDLLRINPAEVTFFRQIPHLPVSFFKTHKIHPASTTPHLVFSSSGTQGLQSRHYVTDPGLYQHSFTEAFRLFYGAPEDWIILALLPSYLERTGSSLIYMADELIRLTNNELSGFFLHNRKDLLRTIRKARNTGKKILLLGVSFALLDLAENEQPDLQGVTVMETGGMKGKRDELTRAELHTILCKAFNVDAIHSEYGMTEMLSQAYSCGAGIFKTPPWLRVSLRDITAPLLPFSGHRGGINITDLANLHSCAFLATDDIGTLNNDGSFFVAGRADHSDIRGCNLLLSE